MDLPTFVAKWQSATLTERAASQPHFTDLCHVLGQPTPSDIDHEGSFYAFEKGAKKSGGGDGWADVWKRGHFAWEYKGKHKDLKKAYQQIQQYREDLENPPLLVVCDLDRFEVHTNFTGTVHQTHAFGLADLLLPDPTAQCAIPPLRVLQALFTEPEALRPGKTAAQVTQEAAGEFARLARNLEARGHSPLDVARFLMRLLFCLFAEDIPRLLPDHLFSRLVDKTRNRPDEFLARVRVLFDQMATGGAFGVEDIPYFTGGLFADGDALPLTSDDLAILARVGELDWASIEPSIFGTLFERSFDPAKRSQIGAHYTGRDDILLIIEPVLMLPLRRQWASVQEDIRPVLEEIAGLVGKPDTDSQRRRTYLQGKLRDALAAFVDEIAAARVLDPACGSGNFLYVALKCLLDLWKEVMTLGQHYAIPVPLPLTITPKQLYGIEIDVFAHQLASIVVWIGYIQWLHENGFGIPEEPILRPLDNILCMDALISLDVSGRPASTRWPDVDVIIGNPPFLGDKKMRGELGDSYVTCLRDTYAGRVPGGADLVTYWFDKARSAMKNNGAHRVGLLATQGIRGGANRRVLEAITRDGGIFMAWRDRRWVLEGAAVQVSIVGFDDGSETDRRLNGLSVDRIYPDLSADAQGASARPLLENENIAFLGVMKAGPFDIDGPTAQAMLLEPTNPNGRANSDVVKRRLGGQDLTGRARDAWIIDFGVNMPKASASLYEKPFEYLRQHVYPIRQSNRRPRLAERWWIHGEARPGLRRSITNLPRYIATPEVAKHRVFAWVDVTVIPDHQLIVFAREDDYFFGVLHSRIHELWARRQGTQLREAESGFRYTPSSVFTTFPFPFLPTKEPLNDPRIAAITKAASGLVQLRNQWLDPIDASDAELKKRTLTNLYNQRPTWLTLAHERLDHAVLYAYGWPHDIPDDEILVRLLQLNQRRSLVVHTQPVIQRAITDPDAVAPSEEMVADEEALSHLSDAG